MAETVLAYANGWFTAVLCLTVAMIHGFRPVLPVKRLRIRLKAVGYVAFALVFVLLEIGAFPDVASTRAALRLVFALMTLHEIGTYQEEALVILKRAGRTVHALIL